VRRNWAIAMNVRRALGAAVITAIVAVSLMTPHGSRR
jgi:hypothetical protein